MHRGPETWRQTETQHSDASAATSRDAVDERIPLPPDATQRLWQLATQLQEAIRGPFPELLQTVKACEDLLQQRQQWEREREEFVRQRNLWEHERQEQLEQLESEYQALRDAWDDVEAQRRAASSQQAANVGSARSSLATHEGEDRHTVGGSTSSVGGPAGWVHGEGDNMDVLDTGLAAGAGTEIQKSVAESYDFAFQQLRREIRKHSRRQY